VQRLDHAELVSVDLEQALDVDLGRDDGVEIVLGEWGRDRVLPLRGDEKDRPLQPGEHADEEVGQNERGGIPAAGQGI